MGLRWESLDPVSRAIAVMVASTVFFSTMHATIRLSASELHPFQIAFFRNFFGLLVFLPFMARLGPSIFRTGNIRLHVLRAGLNVVAMLTFFTALTMTPIAQVTALGFTAPIFCALLGTLLLGEELKSWRLLGVVGGFTGALIVLRPDVSALDMGSLLTLVSAIVWSVCMIIIKVLARTDSSMTITAYMSLLLSVLSLPPALFVWQTPSWAVLGLLVIIGVTGTLAQWTLAEALKSADAGVVMPFDFLKLAWASLAGFLLFSEVPTVSTSIGALVIFASATWIVVREHRPAGRG